MNNTEDLESVCNFLAERGIDSSTVEKFKNNKMDSKAVALASEETLRELGILAVGDILSLRSFCKLKNEQALDQKSSVDREERKRQLVEILRQGKSTRLTNSNSTSKLRRSKIVKTKLRKVYLGWILTKKTFLRNQSKSGLIKEEV